MAACQHYVGMQGLAMYSSRIYDSHCMQESLLFHRNPGTLPNQPQTNNTVVIRGRVKLCQVYCNSSVGHVGVTEV